MSMLARYKKGTGIVELVKLIEDSAEPKKTQLLQMVRGEDAEFALKVEARLFTFEKFKSLPESVIAEIIAATPPKFVALAVQGESEAFVKMVEKCLGKAFNEYRAEKETLAGAQPNAAQIETGRRKLIAEARKLEASGAIKLPFSEPEDAGKSTAATGPRATGAAPGVGAGAAASSSSAAASSAGAAGPNANALNSGDDNSPPSFEAFGIEPAPPGLSGERFETFIKTQLGK